MLGGAIAWAIGSLYARYNPLPRSALLGTGMEMLIGGLALIVGGVLLGEVGRTDVADFSQASVVAFLYLVVFGSIVAFTAYTWLLANVPVSTVATYAYVNPVVAVALGALFYSEPITPRTLIAAHPDHRCGRGDGLRPPARGRRDAAGPPEACGRARPGLTDGTDPARPPRPMTEPIVSCRPAESGWHCTVMLGTDPGRHHPRGERRPARCSMTSRRACTPDELVRVSFEFLLEREPRESIMRQFELPIIGRFFGDYRDEMLRRLAP